MLWIHYSCQILMKLEFSWQIFKKYWSIKFHDKSSTGSHVVPCWRTDRHDKANSHFSQFCKHSLTQKKHKFSRQKQKSALLPRRKHKQILQYLNISAMTIYLSFMVCTVCWTDNCCIVPNVYWLNLIILSHQSFNWHLKYYITRLHSQYMYTKITQKWSDFNTTLKQSCQFLIADNSEGSLANWNNFFLVSTMQNIRTLMKLLQWGKEYIISNGLYPLKKCFCQIFVATNELPQHDWKF